MDTKITRDNIDKLLDSGQIEVAMSNGKWWTIRRNGATRKWKRNPHRLAIPYKMGLYGYGTITELDFQDGTFALDGALYPTYYRVKAG